MSINPPPGGYPEQQPGYGQPGYQQDPGYPQQGGYPQPEYPQQQPDFPPQMDPSAGWAYPAAPLPPKKSNTLKIVLLSALAVVLIGGGVIAYLVLSVAKSVGADKLALPATFQSYARQDGSPLLASAQGASQGIAEKQHLTPAIAIYGPPGKNTKPSFAFMGGYGSTPGAQFGISQFWAGMSSNPGVTISSQTTESPGPLGGAMQCAEADFTTANMTVPICTWADNSGFGAIMDYSRANTGNLGGTAAMTLAFRSAAEVKK